MKQIIFSTVLVAAILFNASAQMAIPADARSQALQSTLDKYSKLGIPGISLAVYSEKSGWWQGASGFANVEKAVPMTTSHLQYTQSVTKTYMAVAILKLKEQGKIAFDEPITKYLPERYSKYIKSADKVTVRMLLNHTSGIPEYSTNPALTSFIVEHPLQSFSVEDCLKSIANEDLQFTPGTKYRYTNTNYQLLSLIADKLTGDHSAFIRSTIFEPLGLKNSFYSNDHKYLRKLPLTDSYWDVLNVERPANVSGFQQANVSSLKGDDGIVCTPRDAAEFIKALMDGKLLSPESMKEMLTFVKDENGQPKYGMGMFNFDFGGLTAYGHGGGGVGAGCILLYIPANKTYLFLATNFGVLVEGGLTKKAEAMKGELLGILLQ
jgi:D-alanyl-D-alanine carboxypeptidase